MNLFPDKRQGDQLRAAEVNILKSAVEGLSRGELVPTGAGANAVFTEAAIACDALPAIDLGPYRPAKITGHVYTGAKATFNRVLKVDDSDASKPDLLCITGGAMSAGIMGQVFVHGMCLCYVKTHSGDKYLSLNANSDDFLTGSATDGIAQLISDYGGASTTKHLALVRFPRGNTVPLFIVCKARADFTSIPSGTTTEDGVSCSAGDLVFNVHDGKVYSATSSGAWTVFSTAADFVYISSGTDYGNLVYVRAASGSYFAISGSYA